MLQQTTTTAVIPYFQAFIRHWPTVEALAKTSRESVLEAFAGLGYYRRAHHLHACAQRLVEEYKGIFPQDIKTLKSLPGVGPYTAGALRAIAFNKRAVAVDGNAVRVMARLFDTEEFSPLLERRVYALLEQHTPEDDASSFVQGLMDLGACVCTPKNPQCNTCPLGEICVARARQRVHMLPLKKKKAPLQTRVGISFLIEDENFVLLRTRPLVGLLGGMLEVPTTLFITPPHTLSYSFVLRHLLIDAIPQDLLSHFKKRPGCVEHTFTHFHLKLVVFYAERHNLERCCKLKKSMSARRIFSGRWMARDTLKKVSLPRLMHKVLNQSPLSPLV